jgi:hypothetical protein
MRARLDAARAAIVAGQISVVDYTTALRCTP